ncbi:MAG: SHD1 domain-containing protein [Kiritimatiellaceae bacterium]|nr:SHD1 domain-containing protein [Kiritimatiellaceae bacterium]
MKSLLVVLGVLVVTSVARAEMRVWTSVKGDTIEAEYVNIIGTKVVLKSAAGKILKVPKNGLCRADLEYLAQAIPPKIEIDVDMDKDRDTLDSYSSCYGSYNYERKAETAKCSVTLTKKNREPSNRELVATIYVLVKSTRGSTRKVVSYATHKFSFKNSKAAQFAAPAATVEYTKSDYVSNHGQKFEGYLVIVEDQDGNVVATETNQSKYENHVHKFKKAKKGTRFDSGFDILN